MLATSESVSAGEVIPHLFGASGEQEVPPVVTPATGGCLVILDVMQINVVCAHTVANATAAHLHSGAPGATGPVLFDLGDPSSSPFSANWSDPTPQQIADLRAGNVYVNIHSVAHPTGEIRGQVIERGFDNFVFPVDESQSVPPTGSPALGTCSGGLSDNFLELTLQCVHDVVMPTAAHIHFGAAGANGPIRLDLGAPTSPIAAALNLSPTELAELAAGLLYVNIHSGAFPGGEIRGQMVVVELFADGFESGNTTIWSSTGP